MKKIFSTLFMALTAVAMMAQQPVITFEKTEHDFGKINEADGRVSTVFEFKNEGMAPLILSNVRASCGCTTPTWTKEPIEPGKTGSITVTYNPNGRPGRFQKTVTITSNASEATKRVYIKGEVIPKAAKRTITKGESKSGELEYANLTKEDHHVELSAYITNQVTLADIKPEQTGKFIFVIDTKDPKMYGPQEGYAYVVIDGKKEIDEAHKLTIKANVVEDFSGLTVEQKQQAPIIEVPAEFNAGKVVKGKNLKFYFPIKNIGANPLEIRRVYAADKALNVKQPKAVKSGKKGNVGVEINTKNMTPGAYGREVVVITNDYLNPIKRVKINFVVE